jgi:kynurenine formamidase
MNSIVLMYRLFKIKRNKNDSMEYIFESPWLGESAAQYLTEKRINAVGIDHFSIGGANPQNVCIPHDKLMGADILIFEDMMLPESLLEKERWYVAAFPINIGNVSGSFARIVALDFD